MQVNTNRVSDGGARPERLLTLEELEAVSGGFATGMPSMDPESGQYTVVSSAGPGPHLYTEIGGRWVPTGTEPFIGPARL